MACKMYSILVHKLITKADVFRGATAAAINTISTIVNYYLLSADYNL